MFYVPDYTREQEEKQKKDRKRRRRRWFYMADLKEPPYCVECTDAEAHYLYKGNSLCWGCLARIKEENNE